MAWPAHANTSQRTSSTDCAQLPGQVDAEYPDFLADVATGHSDSHACWPMRHSARDMALTADCLSLERGCTGTVKTPRPSALWLSLALCFAVCRTSSNDPFLPRFALGIADRVAIIPYLISQVGVTASSAVAPR